MGLIFNLLNLTNRQEPRVAVEWLVDVQVPETESYVGFRTRDISLPGVRLEAETPEAFKRMIGNDGLANMRLRVPGCKDCFKVRAELKWGLENSGGFLTGWRFTRMARPVRRALRDYIEANPELVVTAPDLAAEPA